MSTMHGQKKADYKAQTHTIAQTKDYMDLVNTVMNYRQQKIYTVDSHSATTKLLELNPEFYTIWNFRRLILKSLKESSDPKDEQDATELLKFDLNFTLKLLKKSPKSYWIFNHRKWTTIQLSSTQNEVKLVNMMLDLDARNFHGWDYRRTLGLDPQKEFEYTTLKLTENFSNWSAVII